VHALPVRSRSVRGRSRSLAGAALVGVALLGTAGCSGTEPGIASGDDGATAAVATPPPPPPAACLLDVDAMAGTTGLTWTPDPTTASDTRCVYDPASAATPTATPTAAPTGTAAEAPGRSSSEFVAVDIAPATGQPTAAQLDVLAQVCEGGSRAPAGSGFVCRFGGGSVYAGLVRDGDVITLAASAVPAGTTAAALTVAFGEQVTALG
jgi:hypothetical protein